MMDIIGTPEGATPLDLDEIAGLKLKHITTRGELNEVEQANILLGLTWLEKQKNAEILTEHFLKQLHKKLFGEVWAWAGTFRRTEKNIGVDPFTIAVDLRNLLDDVRCWIEFGTYPALEIAARFHHKLVYIHLFPNGNGRHSRIIADAVLTTILKEEPIDWGGGFHLEEMNSRRGAYISALRAADAHDFSQLIAFVSENHQ